MMMKDSPMRIDLDTLRSEVRALDYVRGTPAEDTMWREDDEDARANLAIEGIPPTLATQILLRLLGHPDADPALAITPAGASC
jgi:hypothetical protein